MNIPFVLAVLSVSLFIGNADARTQRSNAAITEFKRIEACPSNGNRRGPCPGYQVDHRVPLKCGGPDHYTNMQWLTITDHKAKTKREASLCRNR